MQAPVEEKVVTEGEQALALTKTVTLLRGICNNRLKFHIEYGLKRGTTENCYVIKVGLKETSTVEDLLVPKSSCLTFFPLSFFLGS